MSTPGDPVGRVLRTTVEALGVRTELRVEDGAVDAVLRRLLRGLSTRTATGSGVGMVSVLGRGPYDVVADGRCTTADTVAAAVAHCLAELNQRATTGSPLLTSHCALLARDGAGLVVPAASGSGKSTLTAALVRRGWVYGSDEAIGLAWDHGQAVMPYPRALALSPWSASATGTVGGLEAEGETYHLPTDRVQAAVGVRDVVVLRRASGAPTLERVHRAVALQELIHRSFTLHRDPGRALLRYADLLRGASCWQLSLGDPLGAAELLTSRLVDA